MTESRWGGQASSRWSPIIGSIALALLCACSLIITPIDRASLLSPLRPEPRKRFERVVIVVLENEDASDAARDDYLGALAKQGSYLANFRGLFHNSYPNYLAMVSGTIFNFAPLRGANSDRQIDWPPDHMSIADRLEAKHLRWRNYAEDYPGRPEDPAPYLGDGQGKLYRRKHVPFLSYMNITETSSGRRRFQNVVSVRSSDPDNAFARDARSNALPEYSFYSPNMKNDGHDTGLAYASAWLKSFLSHGGYAPRDATDSSDVRGFPPDTFIVVTFDESAKRSEHNRIYTALWGDMVRSDHVSQQALNHYNVLSTIEQNFGLEPMAEGDAWAKSIEDVWRRP